MPDVRVLNELQIKKNGVVATYRLGTVNGYYNPTDGKFYEEVTHVTEIEGAPNLVYADIAGNALYIYKTATSSFVKVSGSGGGSADNLKFGYLNETDGKFYEDDQYQVEIPGNADYLFIGLDNDTIYRYDTSDTAFVSIGGGGGGTEYQAGTGIDITDDVISGNYKGGFNIKIDGDEISTKTFVGTLEEWNNLTSAQKAKFDTVSITDDGTTPIATPGHEVLDSTDTPLPQRTNIQFEGAEATDDSVNDITKVTIIPYTAGEGIEIHDYEVSVTEDRPATFVGTIQEWDALTAAEKAQYKIVNLTDDVAGGEMVVVDAVENGNLNPVSSNAVYDFPIDSITNGSLRPVTSNAVRDFLYDLEDSLKYRHINGTALSPMTADPYIYYNANSVFIYFYIATGDYTCNQLYNDAYYARIASFTTSNVNIAFPGATEVTVGNAIVVGRCLSNKSDGIYTIYLYRYNTSTWYLISTRMYSSTSGTKVTVSANEYLYCPMYGKTSYFGFPEV